MRVIEPKLVDARRPRRKDRKPSRAMRTAAIAGAALIAGYVLVVSLRFFVPLPSLRAETRTVVLPAKSTSVDLPDYGQAAVSATGFGELASSGGDEPRPIASVSKIITALTILDKYPLKSGQSGPNLTLAQADVDLYQEYISKDGAVVAVQSGEQISQYQALQAMLLLSANNMADSLARWAFGSVDKYTVAANEYLLRQGLVRTKVDDASGFSPKTVSTAREVVRLGELAMKNEVLAEVVGQRTAVVPVAGEIRNINGVLGQNGIDGIKTGNTDEAGGCFLTTAKISIGDRETVRAFVAVIGAPKRSDALTDGRNLLTSLGQNFEKVSIAAATTAGYYHPEWSNRVAAKTKSDLSLYRWKGHALRASTSLREVKVGTVKNTEVGTMTLTRGNKNESTPVLLSADVQRPDFAWRVRRALAW